MSAFLEVVVLKCPKCGNLIAEPSWFSDLEQDITCAVCRKDFNSKKNEIDRKMIKFEINKKIKRVSIV